MNLHPIIVHFPIALLILYGLMELVRFKKVINQPYWFYIKAVLVMVGGLGALAALATGDTAAEMVRAGDAPLMVTNFRQVVSLHKNFADLSVAIFGILAAGYLVLWVEKTNYAPWTKIPLFQKIWSIKIKLARVIIETRFVVLLAVAGLVCISITGGLGGIMVFGPSADPFFGFIYQLLFP
ncbi:MAG: DUF2231 domain-containing protein [Candidatus Doudnabacteria bacterium]|jgi:uncharacterized membrane protein